MSEEVSPQLWAGIDKDKINLILKRFIDVLKINIFIVCPDGQALVMPYDDRHGWKLLANSPIGNKIFQNQSIQLNHFRQQGQYREFQSQLDFHNFALPIQVPEDKIIGYLIVGPVLLSKRRNSNEYEQIAGHLNLNPKELLDSINEIRVVSHLDMKSIMDLLDEVVRYSIQVILGQQKVVPSAIKADRPVKERKFPEETPAQTLAIFETLLEVALNITKAECGSIMVINDKEGNLTIKVSRGLKGNFKEARLKIGEGIAGLAAQNNESFLIHGTQTDNNRIKPYLKRDDIKHALVTPLTSQERVFGVLNLHTKNEETPITPENLNTIHMLSKLIAAAFS